MEERNRSSQPRSLACCACPQAYSSSTRSYRIVDSAANAGEPLIIYLWDVAYRRTCPTFAIGWPTVVVDILDFAPFSCVPLSFATNRPVPTNASAFFGVGLLLPPPRSFVATAIAAIPITAMFIKTGGGGGGSSSSSNESWRVAAAIAACYRTRIFIAGEMSRSDRALDDGRPLFRRSPLIGTRWKCQWARRPRCTWLLYPLLPIFTSPKKYLLLHPPEFQSRPTFFLGKKRTGYLLIRCDYSRRIVPRFVNERKAPCFSGFDYERRGCSPIILRRKRERRNS